METVGAAERAYEENIDYTGRVSSVTGYDKNTAAGISLLASLVLDVQEHKINNSFPGSSYLLDEVINFHWGSIPEAQSYEFRIIDRTNNIIYSQVLYDTSLLLNINTTPIKKGRNYYWYVASGDRKSDENCIQWLADYDAQQIIDTVSMIISDFDSHGPMEKLTLAQYYEDMNIMNRAVEAYDEALMSAPTNKNYRSICCRFLKRIGQYEKASFLEAAK